MHYWLLICELGDGLLMNNGTTEVVWAHNLEESLVNGSKYVYTQIGVSTTCEWICKGERVGGGRNEI